MKQVTCSNTCLTAITSDVGINASSSSLSRRRRRRRRTRRGGAGGSGGDTAGGDGCTNNAMVAESLMLCSESRGNERGKMVLHDCSL